MQDQQKPEEKRRHPRIQTKLNCTLTIGQARCHGRTRNLSFGGVLIRLNEIPTSPDFSEGKTIECIIRGVLDLTFVSCPFKGEIVRTAGHDIALMFFKLEPHQRTYLERLIEQSP